MQGAIRIVLVFEYSLASDDVSIRRWIYESSGVVFNVCIIFNIHSFLPFRIVNGGFGIDRNKITNSGCTPDLALVCMGCMLMVDAGAALEILGEEMVGEDDIIDSEEDAVLCIAGGVTVGD